MLILYNFLLCVLIWTIETGASSRVVLTSDEENGPLEVVKGFSLVNILSESSALLTWQKPESVRVSLRGFKIETWVENDKETNYKEILVGPDVSKVLVNILKPNSINFVRIRPYNSQRNGPPSDTISIQMPEGVPGPVQSLTSFPLGPSVVMLQWKRPLETNGKLQGYKIYHQSLNDDTFQERNGIIDSDAEQAKIYGLIPNWPYRFKVVGFTTQGNGADYYTEQRTLPATNTTSTPTTPGLSIKCILSDSKLARAKIIWHPDFAGTPGTHFYVKYRMVGETSFLTTNPVLYEDHILFNELEPNEQFEFSIVAVGDGGETSSQPQRYFSSYQC